MREDFEEHLRPWAAQFPSHLRVAAFTWERFKTAASWVASRAFGVDGWHGADPTSWLRLVTLFTVSCREVRSP